MKIMFGSVLAGVVSAGLFAVAWFWNDRMQSSKIVGWVCVTIAVLGSVVLYASAIAMWLSEQAVSLFNGVGGMVGVGNAAPWVLGFVCIAAFGVTVYDLLNEPEHNPGAVAAMIVAPIAAHGTNGVLHGAMEVVYGGLSLGTLDALQRFFGG
jgi:hypothetical protein